MNPVNQDQTINAQRRLRRRTVPQNDAPAEEAAEEQPADVPEKPEYEKPFDNITDDEKPEYEKSPAAPEPAEPLMTAQSADSRVPQEARRMAAAPYGTAKPEARRPGTRPQVAPRRPAMPESSLPKRQAARPGVPDQRRQMQVGYAPGRMSEDMTRKIPSAETMRESAASRDARAYLEKRKRELHPGSTGNAAPPEIPVHRTLKTVVAVILLAGFVLGGYLYLRDRNGDRKKDTLRVVSFEARDAQGLSAPADVTFSAVTDKDVQEIRLTDEDRQPVDVTVAGADYEDTKGWIMTLHVENGFDGTVRLEVRRNDDEAWQPTEHTAVVMVNSIPETPTPEPGSVENTPEPTMNGEVIFTGGKETPEPEGDGDTTAAREEAGPVTGDLWQEEGGNGADADEEADLGEETEIREDAGDDSEEDREVGALRTAEPIYTPEPEEAKPTATPPLAADAAPEANPDLITSVVIYSGNKKEKEYNRPAKELIQMPEGDAYTTKNLGVMTFRGDNFRRNAAVGTLAEAPTGLGIAWDVEAGSARGVNQTYYGYGWTGQPVIARWSKQVRQNSNLYESKQTKEKLKEVIIAGLDGNIRFLDLDDGTLTRNSIKLGYPMKGTPSLHTRGAPFISVGQFARKMKVKTGKIGLRQYNLYSQKELKLLDGLDGKQHRPLNDIGSFETSALIDRVSDTLIAIGSNGMLYLESLDSVFDYNAGVLTISPSVTVMTSRAKGQKNNALTAVESSLAAYDKYVFYADMGGVLRCVNTDILTPVWAVETGDSVMAAVALDLAENRELNLYTANMLNNRKKGAGNIQIRRYDALSGREIWCTDIGVYKGKKDKTDVGAKASPVIGQKGLDGLVYFTVTGLSDDGRGQLGLAGEEPAALIALDKETGRITWACGLESRSESSPVAVYDEDGNGWIIQCEQDGTIHLLEGLTGRETGSLKLEAEIEASPAVYGDMMVIGTTGKGTSFVYGIEIKTGIPQAGNGEAQENGQAAQENEDAPQEDEDTAQEYEDPAQEEEAEEDEVSGGA